MSKPGSRTKKPADATKQSTPRRARKASPESPADSLVSIEPAAPAALALPADLRIGSAAKVHEDVLARRGTVEVVIDGEGVVKVDAAGLQALLAGLIQISRSGGSWRWHNPSTALVQGVTVLGLGESLRLP